MNRFTKRELFLIHMSLIKTEKDFSEVVEKMASFKIDDGYMYEALTSVRALSSKVSEIMKGYAS